MEPLEALELPEETVMGNGTSALSSNGTALLAPPAIENVTAPLPFVPEPVAGVPPVAIFALGRISVQFPTLAIEKEFAHAASQIDTSGKSDLEARHLVLSAPENRYLLHHLCWVFSVEGLETYILHPRNPAHYDLLVNAIRPVPSNLDVDIVIGMRGEAEQFGKNFQLAGIETHASRLSGARKVIDVIFSYRHRQTDVSEKYFVRVDVTEEYPFLVSKLAHYFSR